MSGDEDEERASRANRALLVQLLVEEHVGAAHALEWKPNAGVVATSMEAAPTGASPNGRISLAVAA